MKAREAGKVQIECGDTTMVIDQANAIIATAVMLVVGVAIYIKRNKIN